MRSVVSAKDFTVGIVDERGSVWSFSVVNFDVLETDEKSVTYDVTVPYQALHTVQFVTYSILLTP
jgi:hypothetical protein